MPSTGRRFRRRKSTPDNVVDTIAPMEVAYDLARTMDSAASAVGSSGDVSPTRTAVVAAAVHHPTAPPDTAEVSLEDFVTQPPRPAKGLTGKISTLFRRESSRERGGEKVSVTTTSAKNSSTVASVASLDDAGAFSAVSGVSSAGSAISSRRRYVPPSPHIISSSLSQQQQHYMSSAAAAVASSNSREASLQAATTTRSRSADSRGVAAVAAVAMGGGMITTTATTTRVQSSSIAANASSVKLVRRNSNDSVHGDARSVQSVRSRSNKRIFYSSHQDDDDSDDSYESRTSRHSRSSRGGGGAGERGRSRAHRGLGSSSGVPASSRETTTTDDSDYVRSMGTGDFSTFTDGSVKVIKRFRGFSTSIRSLFLDESLVCGAFGCFGLILSNRTEYLLQLRNERRGAASGSSKNRFSVDQRRKMPSRIIATGLVLMLLLMFTTFIIWGFGTGNGVVGDYLNGYDYYDQTGQEEQWDDYLGSNGYSSSKYKNYNADDEAGYNNNDDNANAADDQQEQDNDDDGDNARRRRDLRQRNVELSLSSRHGLHGVFKIRDYQENLWDPVAAIVRNELSNRNDVESNQSAELVRPDNRQRNIEQVTDDTNADEETESDGSSASTQNSYKGYQKRRDLASDIRLALLIVFLIFLGFLGRRRRMRTRFYLVRARAQEDHLYYASSDEAASRRVALDDAREDQYEGACSHTLCGCYPVDESGMADNDEENVEVTDKGIFRRKKKPHHEDIVARTFNLFLSACCGTACRCWFQCLSICALAQEAREVRLLIPPRYQRIDYITHQPFHEYQEAVNDLRRGWLGKARRVSGIMPHFNALSRLSRYILILSISTIVIIVATLIFNPRAAFSWQDAVVLIATFLQSFVVLFFVHWIFHKSDLSLDAVIKMFAAGFLIAVPTAFFFEGLLVNVMLFASYSLYYGFVSVIGERFADWVDANWWAIWIVAELFNAYIVAAITEELCKYYTFRTVEHPDLVFLTGLQSDSQDEAAMDGGLVTYPFASHQVQKLARERSFNDDCSISEHSHRSTRSHRSHRSRSRERTRRETLIERTGTTESEFVEDELDARTRRQKAMAITTGMISVAVGLACAENFLYVFVLGGALGDNPGDSRSGDLMEAWIVLFFRSIFPVHALAAAMQSINMIRKFVELDEHNGHRVGVGRIILPAVVLHGTFDAILMGINVFVETAWSNNDSESGDAEPYNPVILNLVAWSSITAIMIGGLFWYYRENRKQGARLKVLEEQDKAMQAEQWIDGDDSKDIEDRIV